jgi:hypothetical protein
VPLSIAIVVIASPAGADWGVYLKHVIDHLQRIDHQRILRAPHSVTDQLQKSAIDYIAGFEVDLFSRAAIVDTHGLSGAAVSRIGISALGRANPHVVPRHARQ